MQTIQLPSLDKTITVDEQRINEFRKNGHTITTNVLNRDEINAYREVINKAAYKYNTEKRSLQERDTYGKAFLQIMNLWEVDEDVRKFTLAKRFAKIAADLLGVEHVRLYHDQGLYKGPGGGLTPVHQGQSDWPLVTHN